MRTFCLPRYYSFARYRNVEHGGIKTLEQVPTLKLPVEHMSVPVIIALLARIQDQLDIDEATKPLAQDTGQIILSLLEMRDLAMQTMSDADLDRQEFPNQSVAVPAKYC